MTAADPARLPLAGSAGARRPHTHTHTAAHEHLPRRVPLSSPLRRWQVTEPASVSAQRAQGIVAIVSPQGARRSTCAVRVTRAPCALQGAAPPRRRRSTTRDHEETRFEPVFMHNCALAHGACASPRSVKLGATDGALHCRFNMPGICHPYSSRLPECLDLGRALQVEDSPRLVCTGRWTCGHTGSSMQEGGGGAYESDHWLQGALRA